MAFKRVDSVYHLLHKNSKHYQNSIVLYNVAVRLLVHNVTGAVLVNVVE
jgi:hypothetical protein